MDVLLIVMGRLSHQTQSFVVLSLLMMIKFASILLALSLSMGSIELSMLWAMIKMIFSLLTSMN